MDQPTDILPALPGQRLARGVARGLRSLNFVCVEEMVLATGLRVDLMALGPKGEFWVIECKSGRADFRADRNRHAEVRVRRSDGELSFRICDQGTGFKWQGYLDYCDRFFWAVDGEFPTDLLPDGTGLIIADAYDAEILRMGPETQLAGARRKAMLRDFARHAALRLQAFRDPGVAGLTAL